MVTGMTNDADLRSSTNQHLAVISGHLTSIDCKHQIDDEEGTITATIGLTNIRVGLVVHAPADEDTLRLVLLLPVCVPADRRAAASEYVLRLNFQLQLGAFELDHDDGEMRFRVMFVRTSDPISPAVFDRVLMGSATTVDGFWPSLMSVVYGGTTPSQAIEQGEAFHRDFLERLNHARKRPTD